MQSNFTRRTLAGWASVALGLAGATFAATPSDPGRAGKELLDFEMQRREAIARKDIPFLESTSSPDLFYVDASGKERNLTEYVAHLHEENVSYNSFQLEDRTVRILGDLGVTTGLFKFDVTVNGRINRGAQYFTAVYVRTGKTWKLLVWHPTTAAPPPG